MKAVDAGGWLEAWAEVHEAGMVYFDFLTAVDRIDTIELVAHAVNPASADHVLMMTSVDRRSASIDSLTPVYVGASWHERETGEMFGIDFAGLIDTRPLLLRAGMGRPPMLKDTVLAARVAVEWPGAADAESASNASRRRQRPPGTPDAWLEPES